eukprot:scaffold9409_cov116-Isochrysis_galbana.AAC.8
MFDSSPPLTTEMLCSSGGRERIDLKADAFGLPNSDSSICALNDRPRGIALRRALKSPPTGSGGST